MHNIETKIKCIRLAINNAREGMNNGEGGPFGAILVNIDNPEDFILAHNTVLKDNDCTAHAEMNVIRNACKHYNTYDLSKAVDEKSNEYKKFVLYTTCYPCPMCMGAIKWANINDVIYCGSIKDCSKLGFKDEKMYNDFTLSDKGCNTFIQLLPDFNDELFKEYNNFKNKVIY